MSLYSYLNRESIVINKLIAFTQTPKFATLMELLMKSDIITTNERLYSTSQNRLTEITIYDSKITISIYPSVLINEYPYEMASIAEIELDPKAGTYTLTNIDGRFHNIIDQIIDDLNYLFYQGMN